MNKNCYPLIIMGMHRSGTSMVAQFLEELGLFIGQKKDNHYEAIFFLRLNDWILSQAHCTWDNVDRFYIINDFFSKNILRVIEMHLKGVRRIEFLGFRNYFKYKNIKDIDFSWGWKDPRNTITIELWKKIFPKAKILNVFRNPVDVAQSLKKRALKREKVSETIVSKYRLKFKEFFLSSQGWKRNLPATASLYSQRVFHIHEGVKLWEDYVQRGLEQEKMYPGDIMHIKYENFIENPIENLERIFDFIKLIPNKNKISDVTSKIKFNRNFAFIQDEELVKYYEKIKTNSLIKKLGYSDIL